MLMYTLEINEKTNNVMIGDKIKCFDKYIQIYAINSIDFNNKKLVVRGTVVAK